MSVLSPQRAAQIEADPPSITFGEVRRLIAASKVNDELVTALRWFADPENWSEEQLSDGPYVSAEWKLGFDPREIAKRAIAKAEAQR
jgi:hypothetical protein